VREGFAKEFAGDHHHLTLAGLVDLPATVHALGADVRGLHVSAEVGAVYGGFAVDHRLGLLGGQGLPDLVGEHEGRFVLHVEVTAQLQGGIALGAVHEDGDGGQDVAQGKLAAGEDRPRGHAELVGAVSALEAAIVVQLIDGDGAAARANRCAFVVGPAQRLEGLEGLVVGHPHDLR